MTRRVQSALIAGCGYLGRRCAKVWHQDGIKVSAITRSEARADQFRLSGLRPVLLDLAVLDEHVVLPRADVVLWAVGFDRGAGVAREQIWLDGLQAFIQSLPSAPRRFVYISSTSVYGQVDGGTVDESSPTVPTTEGGTCCLAAEKLARTEFSNRFPDTQVIVLRMAGIYGPNRLLRRIEDLKKQSPLPGEPDHCLNLIHVDDAVRMVQYVATADDAPELINVVNSGSVTRRQYYSHLADKVAAPAPVFDAGASLIGRQRGGNKRVTCQHDLAVAAGFQFDAVLAGLEDAVNRTQLSG